jgi:hypothetical protein
MKKLIARSKKILHNYSRCIVCFSASLSIGRIIYNVLKCCHVSVQSFLHEPLNPWIMGMLFVSPLRVLIKSSFMYGFLTTISPVMVPVAVWGHYFDKPSINNNMIRLIESPLSGIRLANTS